MTLHKIFKENEEKFDELSDRQAFQLNGKKGTLKNIYFYESIRQEIKDSKLAIIDGVIEMVKKTKFNKTECDCYGLENCECWRREDGFDIALYDLKDELLAERKLIEENEIHSNK